MKSIYKIITIAFIITLGVAVSVNAQTDESAESSNINTNTQTEDSAEASADVDIRTSTKPQRPPQRPALKDRAENMLDKNREIRNVTLEERQANRLASSTKRMVDDRENNRYGENNRKRNDDRLGLRASTTLMMRAERERMGGSTTTEMFKRNKEEKKDKIEIKAKKMKAKNFEIRKNALVRELTVTLGNLDNISLRIDSRITKSETAGYDLSEAKSLFVIAKEKLEKAKADVATFKALTATSTVTTSSGEVEMDLIKPRLLGDTAIKSVKEARDAMKKVIVAITHSQGERAATSTIETRAEVGAENN